MPKTVTYIGGFADGVGLPDGQWVAPGESVTVDNELAGRAPKGKPEDEDYDPGEGLLAQVTNFKAGAKTKNDTSEEPSNG